jgi:hypothetical protein
MTKQIRNSKLETFAGNAFDVALSPFSTDGTEKCMIFRNRNSGLGFCQGFCRLDGILQALAMNAGPGLGIGILAGTRRQSAVNGRAKSIWGEPVARADRNVAKRHRLSFIPKLSWDGALDRQISAFLESRRIQL